MTPPAAVVFDLDGVLVDSETAWNDARREVVEQSGGTWRGGAQEAMMGMSSLEWSRYMREQLGVPLPESQISRAVVERLERLYRGSVPLLPGARQAVIALAARWPLGLASSANRTIIELVLELTCLSRHFKATVSSEEVPHGKPAPDVYFEAARRIGCDARCCAAVEDSANGLRAAAAAGMNVVAIPNRDFPPPQTALALADVVLPSIEALEPRVIEALDSE
jgi:HAD superfamily hydrolase (TIGR01509 family)